MSIQIDLSVGYPVKNLEISELKEWMALNTRTINTTPAMIKARERILFMGSRSSRPGNGAADVMTLKREPISRHGVIPYHLGRLILCH